MNGTTATVTEALRYAALGWPVFPVWPMRAGACACGGLRACEGGKNAGKHPISHLVPKGHTNASTDPAVISAWWAEIPDANIALWCAEAGLVVVDIDPRNGGDASWTALGLPDSPLVADTGGGGVHQFYAAPDEEWFGVKHAGIDLKFNGYVILPPSNHKSGGSYAWRPGSGPHVLVLGLPELPDCFIDDEPIDTYTDEPLTFRPGQMEAELDLIPVSDLEYDDWIALGQALHHQTRGSTEGLDLWLKHTRRSAKYDGDDRTIRYKWRSFGRHRRQPVTMATVRQWAIDARRALLISQFDEEPEDDAFDAPSDPSRPPATVVDYLDLIGSGTSAPAAEVDPIDMLGGDTASAAGGADRDWMELLDFNEEGALRPSLHNVVLILKNDPRLAGIAQINEFTQETVQRLPPGHKPPRRRNAAKPTLQLEGRVWHINDTVNGELWSEDRDFAIRQVIEAPSTQGGYGVKVTDRDLKAAIVLAANDKPFHPVREYLSGLTWDGKPRIEFLFIDYFGADNNPYTRSVGRLFLTGAVTRIFEPGHKFDFSPILEGLQGKRKSTFIETLGLSWFAELEGDFHDTKQMVELMMGAWIMEIPELSAFGRADVRAIKAFISRKKDRARLAYARRAGEFARQCVFMGSTNDREYLRDDTGGRRFWPMPCSVDEIDTDRLLVNLDQIWAEAVDNYRAMRAARPHGTLPLYLTDPEAKRIANRLQESRRVESADDALSGQISAWLDRPTNNGGFDEEAEPRPRNETCLIEIWVECMHKDRGSYKQQEAQMLGRAMRMLAPEWAYEGSFYAHPIYGKQRVYRRGGNLALLGLSDLLG